MKYILVLFTAFIVLAGCKSDMATPTGAVTGFADALKKGDFDAAKKFLTKKDVEWINTAEAAAKMFSKDTAISEGIKREIVEEAKKVDFKVKDEKITGDNAQVNVEIKRGDSTVTRPFQLVKEEGDWKLSLTSTGMGMGDKNGHYRDLRDVNIADSIKKGMEEFKKMNPDSLSKLMKEGFEKMKDPETRKKIDEAMKKIKEATDSMKVRQ